MKRIIISILLLVVVPIELAVTVMTFGVYKLFVEETFTEILLSELK